MDRLSPKQETSEKRKAKQYGAAGGIALLAAVIMTVIRLMWGSVMLESGADKIPLGIVISYGRSLVLLFGAIDLISAAYHFVLWNRSGRKPMEDDGNGLFSDWKSGERSPVQVSLILMAVIVALALVIALQG